MQRIQSIVNCLREGMLRSKPILEAHNHDLGPGGDGAIGLQIVVAIADAEATSVEEYQNGKSH